MRKEQFLKLAKLAKNKVFFYVHVFQGWAMAYTKSGNLLQFWNGNHEAIPVAVMPEDVPLLVEGYLADETSILTDAGNMPNCYDESQKMEPVQFDGIIFNYCLSIDFLKTAKNFMANDLTRPSLSCIGIRDGHIWATDAHVLMYEPTDINGEHAILRDTILDILALNPIGVEMAYRTYINTDGRSVNRQVFRIETKDGFYYMQAPEADIKLPDYFCVIPQDNPVTVSIDRKNLDTAIARVAPATNKHINAISFLFGRTSVELSGIDIDRGTEAKAMIPAECNESLNISFNIKKLQTITKGIKAAFNLYMSTPSRATLIQEPGSKRKYLLMPVMKWS